MDEKGFIIGRSARAKVICRAGRRPPQVTQDGTREMLTVIECCCTAQTMVAGHRSRITCQFIQYAIDHDIVFLCFPPHSTHLLQPLDIGLLSPLQNTTAKRHMIISEKPGLVLSRAPSGNSTALLVVKPACTKRNTKSAVRATGVYPSILMLS